MIRKTQTSTAVRKTAVEKNTWEILENLTSDANGTAHLEMVVHGKLKLFLGRSIIIHANKDDLKSQPTGNAGPRIACGIMGAKNLKN